MVIRGDVGAEILRLHHVEKRPPGTIATERGVHHEAVTRVIEIEGAPPARPQRRARIDTYLLFILASLRRYLVCRRAGSTRCAASVAVTAVATTFGTRRRSIGHCATPRPTRG